MSETRAFPWPLLHEFCLRVFRHLGVPEDQARLSADVLSAADRRGIDSHGVPPLRTYCDLLSADRINARPRPRTVRETPGMPTADCDKTPALAVVPCAYDPTIEDSA